MIHPFFFDGFTPLLVARTIEIADALTAKINGHAFSQSFTAVRRYADVDAKLEELNLKVEVVPVERVESELDTRGSLRYLASCDVVIRKRVGTVGAGVDASEVDRLVALTLEVNEWLTARTLDDGSLWDSTTIIANVIHKHLREWSQYTGILRVTYYLSQELNLPANV